jgi:hypothetical protein
MGEERADSNGDVEVLLLRSPVDCAVEAEILDFNVEGACASGVVCGSALGREDVGRLSLTRSMSLDGRTERRFDAAEVVVVVILWDSAVGGGLA